MLCKGIVGGQFASAYRTYRQIFSVLLASYAMLLYKKPYILALHLRIECSLGVCILFGRRKRLWSIGLRYRMEESHHSNVFEQLKLMVQQHILFSQDWLGRMRKPTDRHVTGSMTLWAHVNILNDFEYIHVPNEKVQLLISRLFRFTSRNISQPLRKA